jgi:hypothetical protein
MPMSLHRMFSEYFLIYALAFCVFVIYCTIKLFLDAAHQHFDVRNKVGSLGLGAGIGSTALYAVFLIFFLVEHRLILHGSSLWILYYAGESMAVLGCIAGIIGKGWIRRSSLIISTVIALQWWKEMIPSVTAGDLITMIMLIAVVLQSILWLGALLIRGGLRHANK